jgi:hypothetical protein
VTVNCAVPLAGNDTVRGERAMDNNVGEAGAAAPPPPPPPQADNVAATSVNQRLRWIEFM